MENHDHYKEWGNKKMPPLSLLDKAIYFICLFVVVAFICAMLIYKTWLLLFIRFRDPDVIACASSVAEIGTIPILAVLTLSGFMLYLYGLKNQIPIFGNPAIRYGEPPWEGVYPIFWRNKPKKRRFCLPPVLRDSRTIVVLVGFFLCSIFFCFVGLFTRDSLENDPDACLVHYNFLNQRSAVYTVDDIAALTIASDWIQRDEDLWGYTATFRTKDEHTFHFVSLSDYSPYLEDSQTAALELLVGIKNALPPEAVTIEGKEDVDKILETMGFENILLLELFDAP